MTKNNLHQHQNGFVSIMVSMVIMAVLTLITIGFATLMSHEQRQVLDRQLSTQAFYAAEAGVNDAAAALKTNPTLVNITNCATKLPGYQSQLDAGSGTGYSCLLINKSPTMLEYTISTEKSTIIPLNATGPMGVMVIGWEDDNPSGPGSNVAANSPTHALPPKNTTAGGYDTVNGIGMVRVGVMPVGAGGTIPPAAAMADSAASFFAYPNSAGTDSVNYADKGAFIDGNCGSGTTRTGKYCEANITNMPIGTNAYLRLKALYKPVKITIAIYPTGFAGDPLALTGAQAIVDSTGKASDVLRRIQVRVPLTASYTLPEFALQTTDTLCKRIVVWPSGAQVDLPPGFSDVTQACALPNDVTGEAGVTLCDPATGCPPSPGPGAPTPSGPYHFAAKLWNNTNLKGLTVAGCKWDFGDGQTATTSCNPGDTITHDYSPSYATPYPPSPYLCVAASKGGGLKGFTVRITVFFTNGTSDSKFTQVYRPYCQ